MFLTDDELFNLMLLKASTGKSVEDTATGNPVTFLTDLAKPLKQLKINFLPVQSGTGDPSPTNVRPITGWTGVTVNHGADQTDYDTYPVTWTSEGTVYGGYVDLVTGEVWAEYASDSQKWKDMTGETVVGDNTRKNIGFHNDVRLIGGSAQTAGQYSYCNVTDYYLQSNNEDVQHFYIASSGRSSHVILPNNTDGETEIQIVGKLSTPVLITTLTPAQITALVGNNTIWSDANGNVEVTFLKKG